MTRNGAYHRVHRGLYVSAFLHGWFEANRSQFLRHVKRLDRPRQASSTIYRTGYEECLRNSQTSRILPQTNSLTSQPAMPFKRLAVFSEDSCCTYDIFVNNRFHISIKDLSLLGLESSHKHTDSAA